jgi:hypothetical protein
MPSRIDKLTKKQEAAMPAYRDHWIAKGLQTGETDWKTFEKFMPVCYEKAKIPYPKNVVRVQSPLVGALAAAVAEAILRKKGDAVGDAVDGAVRDAVGDAVDGAVRDAVDGAVRDAVGDAVDGAVRDAVGGAVRDAVDGAVRDAVGGAVDGAVRGAVDGAVGDAVDGAVRDAVDGAVGGAVGDAVGDAVRGAVRGAVGDAVRGAVRGALKTAIAIATKAGVTFSWHSWLGGQFWVGGWYWGVAFANFFFDICKLKLSKDIMERAVAYRKVCESVNYVWPNRDFVMVCARPKAIRRNAEGRLHSTEGLAIEYPDGWGLYMIHGVKFTEEQFEKAKKATLKELISWEDIDQRAALLRDKPLEEMLKEAKAVLMDKTDECGGYELYELDLGFRSKVRCMKYMGWSHYGEGRRKTYVKFVPPASSNCLETIAKLRGLTVEEFRSAVKS